MTNTTVTNLRKNLFAYVNQAITYNDPVHIVTKDGNAVMISEDEYQGLMATMELLSDRPLAQALIAGRNEPLADCVPYDPAEAW